MAGEARSKEASRRGGLARVAGRCAATLATVGTGVEDSPAFRPYRRKASSLRKALAGELASLAGGVCGPMPSALLAAASRELAAAQYVFDCAAREGDTAGFIAASKLESAAKQHILAAWEIAVRSAGRRGGEGASVDVDALVAQAEERVRGGARGE